MEPYEQRELGRVGEGLWPIDSTQPLTQLRVSSKLLTLRNPLPRGEGDSMPDRFPAFQSRCRQLRINLRHQAV